MRDQTAAAESAVSAVWTALQGSKLAAVRLAHVFQVLEEETDLQVVAQALVAAAAVARELASATAELELALRGAVKWAGL